MTYTWHRQPITGSVAKAIRKDNRTYRREKGRQGHRFRYDELRSVWLAGEDFVIVTHQVDRTWQLWWRHPEKGWMLQSWHSLLSEAKEEAENPRLPDKLRGPLKNGTYVCAEWRAPYHGRDPIMVRCNTELTTVALSGVFQRLGCSVTLKTVG
jgi:hypothetical protein